MNPPLSSNSTPPVSGVREKSIRENNGTNENNQAPENGNYVNNESDHEVIRSLGAALAGVNLSPNEHSFGFQGVNESGGPFASMVGSAPSQNDNDLGWNSTFSDASQSAFSGGSNAPPPNEGIPETQVKESLELFLSQSPSQALGDDVFKLSSSNLPSLALDKGENRTAEHSPWNGKSIAQNNMPNTVFGEIRPVQEVRRRTDSPSCSITGTATSSRSASPYTNANEGDNRRTIGAYRYDPSTAAPISGEVLGRHQSAYGEEDRSAAGYSLNNGHSASAQVSSQDRNQSPYGRDGSKNLFGSVGSGSPYEKDRNFLPQRNEQQHHLNAASPQQQVLYMAVPSPDGRGQVLQPVQMLQLSGKPFTYVVPGSAGIPGVAQGTLPDGSQNMRVLPPLRNQVSPDHQIINGDGRNPMDHRNKGFVQMDGGGNNFDNLVLGGRDEYGLQKAGVVGVGGGKYAPAMGIQQDTASLYTTPTRPPLDALLGQVRRLSRDQVGCRLVQQALDEEGSLAATLILNEGLPFWSEAMVDPFGNYLFQKILEKITSDERIMLVKSVSSRLVNASLNLHGTRSVQKIVELCALDQDKGLNNDSGEESAAEILTRSLYPAAARLCIDSHGNHVIQRILLKLGPKHSKFVFDAVAASVGDVARHRHGCCVIQRCLDSPPSDARSHLVHRIVEKSLELMQDAYGNYVVQYVLDVCADQDVHAVCESVIGKVNLLAIQKFSSNVMEKCLERCTDGVKERFMHELSDADRIRELMMDPFGNYVVQRALSVATHAQAIRLVEAMRPHLIASQPGQPNGQRNGGVRNTAGGRRIMAKICRRFPNFTLSAAGSQEDLFSQNKTQQNRQVQPTVGTYAPMPAPTMPPVQPQHFIGDPHMVSSHMMNQQQPFFDAGARPGVFDYSLQHSGQGGYPSM